jgi:transcription initiation factor IIE alpha subunit
LPGPDKEAASAIADSHYTVVSQATGISINSIYRLHCIKEKLKKDCFTSDELSNEFGNTRRSMNRIIEKLVKAGYAEIDGTRMLSDSGRPTRIIRLKI